MALAIVGNTPNTIGPVPGPNRPHVLALQLAVVDEVFAQASQEQAVAFFIAVGRRLASGLSLPSDDRLLTLEQAINNFWQPLWLGHGTLTADDEGIVINHVDYAKAGPAASETWPHAAAAVVLGAYSGWFQSLADEPPLQTRLVQQSSDRLIIHHGL
ncbi:cellulose biosynthesis protein BcsD [Polymorphobacter sp.]|uniref:cellulose biosynthesis protein BcsD n=1 Tax=Polymorphobacter sp. TaxID=1909290 RepID=UPI003F70F2EF